MSMFKEHEIFKLEKPIEGLPLQVGSRGTVLIVHGGRPAAYEVEFMEGIRTIAVVTLTEDFMQPHEAGCP